MPKITIKENNLTRGSTALGTDIVYIPGFCNEPEYTSPFPVLCQSITDLEKIAGINPYVFSSYQKDGEKTLVGSNTVDLSYVMAKELLLQGMPVYYHAFAPEKSDTRDAVLIKFYEKLIDYLNSGDLLDRNEYTIKYLTSGGYPNFYDNGVPEDSKERTGTAVFNELVSIASTRGDCIAFAEYINDRKAPLTSTDSFIEYLNKKLPNTDYGTAFYPWANHTTNSSYNSKREFTMPSTFSYLLNLAKSIKTNPNWLAIAGVGRGCVTSIKSLNLDNRLSNAIADAYQDSNKCALNAITNIKPYGYTIWGNRTLKTIEDTGLDATHFLSTRNMICDIKKVCYTAANSLMFEQNSDLLWLDFKGKLLPFFERLKAGRGISNYSIIKQPSTTREELICIITIYPISAVEKFTITINIRDDETVIGE